MTRRIHPYTLFTQVDTHVIIREGAVNLCRCLEERSDSLMFKELLEQHKKKVKEVYRLGRIIGEEICKALSPYVDISFRIGGYESGVETIVFFTRLPLGEEGKEYVSLANLLDEIADEEGVTFWMVDLEEGFCYYIFDFRNCNVPKDIAPQVKEALKRVLFS